MKTGFRKNSGKKDSKKRRSFFQERDSWLESERYRTLIQSLPDTAVFFFDRDLIIRSIGGDFVSRGIINEKSLIDSPLEEAVAPEFVPTLRSAYERVLNGENLEILLNNRQVYYQVNIVPSRKKNGEIEGVISISRDVSRRIRVEQELKMALQEERILGQMKSQFVSMVSHEFRTPLSSILSSTQILKLYGAQMDSVEQKKQFAKIENSIEHILQTLDDVLLLDGAESDLLEPSRAPVILLDLLEDVLGRFRTLTPRRSILLTGSTMDLKTEISVNSSLIHQALFQLIQNALQYSPDDTEVILEIQKRPDLILFRVMDRGWGIPGDEKKKIFQPFYRGEKGAYQTGTGLGLPIVKKAAELHGGKISVEDREGGGSLFTLEIPREFGYRESAWTGTNSLMEELADHGMDTGFL